MKMVDVNVLIYAHREESARHAEYRRWLEGTLRTEGLGVSDLVLSGFLRIVTHPRIMNPPTPRAAALAFAEQIRRHPRCAVIRPGHRHWDLFADLVRKAACAGNHVSDAFHAALAIEAGCEWITTDRDFSRFPGLKWRHPLE